MVQLSHSQIPGQKKRRAVVMRCLNQQCAAAQAGGPEVGTPSSALKGECGDTIYTPNTREAKDS